MYIVDFFFNNFILFNKNVYQALWTKIAFYYLRIFSINCYLHSDCSFFLINNFIFMFVYQALTYDY